MCAIYLHNNEFDVVPSYAFQKIFRVVTVSIVTKSVRSIEADAFAHSSDINLIELSFKENGDIEQTQINAYAFRHVRQVYLLLIVQEGLPSEDKFTKPELVLKPFAFSDLDVGNMRFDVWRNGSMQVLPDNLFTGLTVTNLLYLDFALFRTRIHAKAFGGPGQSFINQVVVPGVSFVPCDCETAQLYANLKVNVGRFDGVTCEGRYPDGSISQGFRLDHATCCAANLRLNLILFLLMFIIRRL